MDNILVAFLAYTIDKIFGEFRFLKHPVILIGDLILFFENSFYQNSVSRGFLLVSFVLGVISLLLLIINSILGLFGNTLLIILSSIIASMFLAHNMLYEAVKEILTSDNKRSKLSMLVSRDTRELNDSEIYKAAIETYAENLSDGVIAPLFYLVLFGLPGIVIYKAINTMDSMVGYRNDRYEDYGKVAAILDDIVNFIPSRITAILIMSVSLKSDIFAFYKDGSKHDSPNAGHPITAMALCLGVKLGGDTFYFGKLKHKTSFGEGRDDITPQDLTKALSMKQKIDLTILLGMTLLYLLIG